jgi:DNA/RNA endonuclease YhcR with UshA esterase domain
MNKVLLLCTVVVLATGLVGCEATTPQPVDTPTPTSPPPPTATPVPADTPQPTDTPPPPATPLPTGTPAPTPTLASTPTAMLTPTPEETPTPVVELTSIEAITAGRVGEEVTVEGTVVGTASFSAGFKFTLDDGTGQIVLLMWHNVYDNCWDAAEINLGAKVQATGAIGQYEGELQIEPDYGGDVKAIEGAAAWATPREVGSLTGDDEGQRVMIEGQVVRAEGLSSAVKVFVSDGTGEIVVFLWRTVLDRIADNTALGTPGSRVRVVGTVKKYEGNLEVVPTLPNDVVVLGMP